MEVRGMEEAEPVYDLAEMAWVLLANVSEGDWTKQPQEWQDAVVKWRDHYHQWLAETSAAAQEVHSG